MKISDITCWPVQAPGRTFVVIVVDTDEGISGYGEAGLQRRPAAIAGAVEHLKRFLVGQDPSRIEHIWQTVFRGGFYPADKLIGSVLAGIDQALWDIKGKRLGVPVYDLLGGRCRDVVECYTHPAETRGARSDATELDQLVDGARAHVEAGWGFLRFGPNDRGGVMEPVPALRRLLEQFAAVREAVGPDVELMADLHTRIDPPEAVWFCRQVEQYRPYFVEDPLRSENPEVYRHLRQHVAVPLAAGEQWSSKWDFRSAIEEHLIDYARIDLCIAGGLTEAKKIAGWAETRYIKVVPHNPLGPISTAAGVHLAFAIDNFGVQELPWLPGTMLPDVFPQELPFANGHFLPPTAPGLGVTFDREAAKEHPGEFTEPPHFRRPDGSFTNY